MTTNFVWKQQNYAYGSIHYPRCIYGASNQQSDNKNCLEQGNKSEELQNVL